MLQFQSQKENSWLLTAINAGVLMVSFPFSHKTFVYNCIWQIQLKTGPLNLKGLISFPMTRKLGRVALVRGRHVSRTRLFRDGQMDHEKHFA